MVASSRSLRILLTAVLLVSFLWQTYMALEKFLAGNVTIVFDVQYPEEEVRYSSNYAGAILLKFAVG